MANDQDKKTLEDLQARQDRGETLTQEESDKLAELRDGANKDKGSEVPGSPAQTHVGNTNK